MCQIPHSHSCSKDQPYWSPNTSPFQIPTQDVLFDEANIAGASSPAESNETGAAKQPGTKADEDGVFALLMIELTNK